MDGWQDGWKPPTSKGTGRSPRLVTWLIVGWTVLLATVESIQYAQIGATKDADVGISIVIGMVVLFFGWLFGFIVLSVVWSRTKPDEPTA
jgi:hypothetical protein